MLTASSPCYAVTNLSHAIEACSAHYGLNRLTLPCLATLLHTPCIHTFTSGCAINDCQSAPLSTPSHVLTLRTQHWFYHFNPSSFQTHLQLLVCTSSLLYIAVSALCKFSFYVLTNPAPPHPYRLADVPLYHNIYPDSVVVNAPMICLTLPSTLDLATKSNQ